MADWPWQPRAVQATLAAYERGQRRLGLTSPTGMGKTTTTGMIVEHFLKRDKKAVIYANRRPLISQLSNAMAKAGFNHGIRAADEIPQHHLAFQISSVQTESQRALKGYGELHPADIVVFDEGHLHTAAKSHEIAEWHFDRGALIIYLTATPVGLDSVIDALIIAGTKQEGFEHGALVRAVHYGPDEPDLTDVINKGSGFNEDGFSDAEVARRMGCATEQGKADKRLRLLYGRIGQHYFRLNPEKKPTLLFAPGIKESLWIVDQFNSLGIPSAHIDGEGIYYGERDESGFPKRIESNDETREELAEQHRTGKIKILSNRFVMREGIDFPWAEHIILATIIGSVQQYIQIGGRGLRACPSTGKTRCIIQDHGGNWWRHGSLNHDIAWEIDLTSQMIGAARFDDLREGTTPEPKCCPRCRMILLARQCPCGFEIDPVTATRVVVTQDGDLVDLTGRILKPRSRRNYRDTAKKWASCFFRARNSKKGMSVAQAEGLFVAENHYWPARDLPYMPLFSNDFYRKAANIPWERIRKPNDPTDSGIS